MTKSAYCDSKYYSNSKVIHLFICICAEVGLANSGMVIFFISQSQNVL